MSFFMFFSTPDPPGISSNILEVFIIYLQESFDNF